MSALPSLSDADHLDMDAEDSLLAARPLRIRTRPGLASRAWRRLRCAWLQLLIWDTERYIDECARHGISDTLSLWEFRRQIEAMRVRLALLEQAS